MISPKGYPQYPEDYNSLSAQEQQAFDDEITAYNIEGPSNYLPNSENNETLEGAVFSWEAPDLTGVTIPDNIIMAYSVHISLTQMDANEDGTISQQEQDDCNQNWENCNSEIYNTWWNNKPVTSNSITLTVPLEVISGEDQYSIGVNVMFLDKETGNTVAEGQGDYAQFTVGAGTALTGDENIRFEGNFSLHTDSGYTATFPSNAKVVLVAEENVYNPSTDTWDYNNSVIATGTIDANASYVLDVNSSTLQANMGQNKWINLVLFENTDNDGEWDNIWDANTQGEHSYWLDGTWMWIENWGDLRINTDSENGEYTSQKVIKYSNVTVQGLDITIW
jgi:hypothetical protein